MALSFEYIGLNYILFLNILNLKTVSPQIYIELKIPSHFFKLSTASCDFFKSCIKITKRVFKAQTQAYFRKIHKVP